MTHKTADEFRTEAIGLVSEGVEVALAMADYFKRAKAFTVNVEETYAEMGDEERADWRVGDDDINDGLEAWFVATGDDAVCGLLLTLQQWTEGRTAEGIDKDIIELENLRRSLTDPRSAL